MDEKIKWESYKSLLEHQGMSDEDIKYLLDLKIKYDWIGIYSVENKGASDKNPKARPCIEHISRCYKKSNNEES